MMPRYDYRCRVCGHVVEVRHGYDDMPDVHCGVCFSACTKLFAGVRIAPSATPTRTAGGVDLAATRQAEVAKAADMDAYKRLRADGLQPPAINGASVLETKAETAHEVNAGHTFSSPASRRRSVGLLDDMADAR